MAAKTSADAKAPIQVTAMQLAKFDQTLRRLCKHNPRRKKAPQVAVADDVKKAWAKGGTARKDLLCILVEAQGDKETSFLHTQYRGIYALRFCVIFLEVSAVLVNAPCTGFMAM